ncbi:hypothetical protein HRbin27_01957 [bacterium HR27]|nr:hypothetical protein HRbin27_01957 [bacterium HR27]
MTFEPRKHLLKTRGGRDHLEARWRIVWLRRHHPDARVITELIQLDREQGFALFRAVVEIPGGGSATGWGSESAADFSDYIEKAETKALSRALRALGYGTESALEEEETSDGLPETQRRAIAALCGQWGIDADALIAAQGVESQEQAARLINVLKRAAEPARSGDAVLAYLAQVADRFELTLGDLERELRDAGRFNGDWSALKRADVLWAEARAYQLAHGK